MRSEISHEYLLSVLSYDKDTGYLFWKNPPFKRRLNGTKAGSVRHDGRIAITLKGHPYAAHRVIWFLVYGKWPDGFLDHINGDPSDNRLCNLREATNSENQQNITSKGRGRSGVLGAQWNSQLGKWQSSIKLNGKNIYLGAFASKEEARNAYLSAKAKIHIFQPTPRDMRGEI